MDATSISHDVRALAQFQRDAASYFDHRPTNGEDMAHFANVYNAANCRATAVALASLQDRVNRLEEALAEWIAAEDAWDCEPGHDWRVAAAMKDARAALQSGGSDV